MHDTLQRLFRFKAWANDELLSALADLGPHARTTDLAVKALAHSHVVDRIFAAHLRGRAHSYASTNPDTLPTLEMLSADIRGSDREYVEYVSALDDEALRERIDFTFTDGKHGCMSRGEMLMHVITHGVGHRGQISALFLLNGMTPPTDGFTTWLHLDRAR